MNPKVKKLSRIIDCWLEKYPELAEKRKNLNLPSISPRSGPAVSGGGDQRPTEKTALRELPEHERRIVEGVEEALRICSYFGDSPDDIYYIFYAVYCNGATKTSVSLDMYRSESHVEALIGKFRAVLAAQIDKK